MNLKRKGMDMSNENRLEIYSIISQNDEILKTIDDKLKKDGIDITNKKEEEIKNARIKALAEIWKENGEDKKSVKDKLGTEEKVKLTDWYRDQSSNKGPVRQAPSFFEKKKNGDMNYVSPNANKNKSPNKISMKDASKAASFGIFSTSGVKKQSEQQKEQQKKDYENLMHAAKVRQNQTIIENLAAGIYDTGVSNKLNEYNVNEAEKGYASIEKLDNKIKDAKPTKLLFVSINAERAKNIQDNLDSITTNINSRSKKNAEETERKKDIIKYPPFHDIKTEEFGTNDKRIPLNIIVHKFNEIGGQIKLKSADLARFVRERAELVKQKTKYIGHQKNAQRTPQRRDSKGGMGQS